MAALDNNWYRCKIDKTLLKSLSQRADGPPLLWFGSYFALLLGLALGIVLTWGQPWCWAFIVAYGLVWGATASGVHASAGAASSGP